MCFFYLDVVVWYPILSYGAEISASWKHSRQIKSCFDDDIHLLVLSALTWHLLLSQNNRCKNLLKGQIIFFLGKYSSKA
jgi:hypothetical protein